MTAAATRRRGLHRDAAGQLTLEWTLVLAAIAIPMFLLIRLCLGLLVGHYQMISFLETIPFP